LVTLSFCAAHPLLSLILASGEAFQAVTSKFVMKQQAAVQESVRSGFDELMKGASLHYFSNNA
jgi:hypothetical protein